MTAKALWPQDPIQESLTIFCNEDTNTKAVAGFKGEWLQAALVPMCTVLWTWTPGFPRPPQTLSSPWICPPANLGSLPHNLVFPSMGCVTSGAAG